MKRKLYLKHFETIEVKIDSVSVRSDGDGRLKKYARPSNTSNPKFFKQYRDAKYSIDGNTIEMKSRQLTKNIESSGIIYENIFIGCKESKKDRVQLY